MGMKLIYGHTPKSTKRPFISTDKFSIKAEVDNNNLIETFEVKTGKGPDEKTVYVPVVKQNYAAAWNKVYNLIKKYL